MTTTFAQVGRNTALASVVGSPRDHRAVGFQSQTVPLACRNGHDVAQAGRNTGLANAVVSPRDHRAILEPNHEWRIRARRCQAGVFQVLEALILKICQPRPAPLFHPCFIVVPQSGLRSMKETIPRCSFSGSFRRVSGWFSVRGTMASPSRNKVRIGKSNFSLRALKEVDGNLLQVTCRNPR